MLSPCQSRRGTFPSGKMKLVKKQDPLVTFAVQACRLFAELTPSASMISAIEALLRLAGCWVFVDAGAAGAAPFSSMTGCPAPSASVEAPLPVTSCSSLVCGSTSPITEGFAMAWNVSTVLVDSSCSTGQAWSKSSFHAHIGRRSQRPSRASKTLADQDLQFPCSSACRYDALISRLSISVEHMDLRCDPLYPSRYIRANQPSIAFVRSASRWTAKTFS